MIAFDTPAGQSEQPADRNLLGQPLIACSTAPLTGFFRDGACRTCREDTGSHTVCAVMTAEFKGKSRGKSRTNTLSFCLILKGYRFLETNLRQFTSFPFNRIFTGIIIKFQLLKGITLLLSS